MARCVLPDLPSHQTPFSSQVSLLHAVSEEHIASTLKNAIENFMSYPGKLFYASQNLPDGLNSPPRLNEDRIYSSPKIIFLLTPKYVKYEWRPLQVDIALQKARGLRMFDCFAVVIPQDLAEGRVEQDLLEAAGLQDFQKIYVYDSVSCPKLIRRLDLFICGQSNIKQMTLSPDTGIILAQSYYCHLRIKIPELASNLRRDNPDLFETKQSDGTPKRVMSSSYLIIIPDSLFCPPVLNDLDARITTEQKIECKVSRGGVRDRDFSTAIHRLQLLNGQFYRFMGEVPDMLVDLYDMQNEGKMQVNPVKRLIINQFYSCLKDLLGSDGDCRGNINFVFYKDSCNPEPFGNVLKQVIEKEIKRELAREANPAEPRRGLKVPNPTARVSDHGLHRVETYESMANVYALKKGKLGRAYIINNKYNGVTDTDKVERLLIELLEKLKFEVIKKRNLKAGDMHKLANEWYNTTSSSGDEVSDDQAFFCAIIGYGNHHGQLEGADGKHVNFSDMASMLQRSKHLKGKPKLLLVEASENKRLGAEAEDGISRSIEEVGHLSVQPSEEFSAGNQSVEKNLQRRASVDCLQQRRASRQQAVTSNILVPCVNDCLSLFSAQPGSAGDAMVGRNFVETVCEGITEGAKSGRNLVDTFTSVVKTLNKEKSEQPGPVIDGAGVDLGITQRVGGAGEAAGLADDLGIRQRIPYAKHLAFYTSTLEKNLVFGRPTRNESGGASPQPMHQHSHPGYPNSKKT